jgi:hypothetical protein
MAALESSEKEILRMMQEDTAEIKSDTAKIWNLLNNLTERLARQDAEIAVLKTQSHSPADCKSMKAHQEDHVSRRTLVLGVVAACVGVSGMVIGIVKAFGGP